LEAFNYVKQNIGGDLINQFKTQIDSTFKSMIPMIESGMAKENVL